MDYIWLIMNSTASDKFSILKYPRLKISPDVQFKMKGHSSLYIVSARITQTFGFEATVVQLNSVWNADTFPW